jgi:predicted dehydrogenase
LDERYAGETPDILDNGYVICDFANGTRAMLELCMFAEGSRYQEEISAVGPRGKIEAMVLGPRRFHTGPEMESKLVISPRADRPVEEREIPVDEALLEAGDHNGATFYQHQKFLDVVRDPSVTPEVALADGWAAVRMGQAAQQSIESGQCVTLDW